MDDYITKNNLHSDYLTVDYHDLEYLDPAHDFWIKTECYYMAESEIKGILVLKKDSLVF